MGVISPASGSSGARPSLPACAIIHEHTVWKLPADRTVPTHLAKSITHSSYLDESWPSEKGKVDIYLSRNQSSPSRDSTRGPRMRGTREHTCPASL